ncbi:hypothetical protein NX786_09660 [Telluria mixta]|uniref:Uncharacterized protein n=1 Tax=Telluria mixta TaxID=34071 RepID=A0ABT2BYY8_9BURK|nr:hypothetical protein [Telluria mixta]MCS0629599.1 hypothetical protein [Telluria mixta]WEM96830.1 hypothetical protein P0M04_03555 [Telluria mixta]
MDFMFWKTLLTALLGALIAAALSFYVRKTLDRRSIEKTEQRLAHVHFVHLSAFIATEIAVTSILKIFLPKSLTEELKDKEFDLSHAACAAIAIEVQKDEFKQSLKSFSMAGMLNIVVDTQIEFLSGSMLTPDQLSKLPEEGVATYVQFVRSLSNFQTMLRFIKELGDDDSAYRKDLGWATADFFHSNWRVIQSFSEDLKAAYFAMRRLANVPAPQAQALLKNQLDRANRDVSQAMTAKTKLALAALDIDRKHAQETTAAEIAREASMSGA